MSDNDLIRRGDALALFLAIDDLRHMNVGQATVLFAERRAALIALPAAQPTVKPLVWVGSVAKTSFGTYYIVDLGPLWVAPGRFDVSFSGLDVARAEDEQSAKAAAQADYEARILSALDMQPTVSPDVAALVEALRSTLNFIENTEGEMGVILGCGDKARAALASVEGVM